MDEKEFLNQFGETFINDVRKQTILEMNKVLAGDYKAEESFLKGRYRNYKGNICNSY